MQETSAAALGLEATIDAETQPFGIGEFRAVAAVSAGGKQIDAATMEASGFDNTPTATRSLFGKSIEVRLIPPFDARVLWRAARSCRAALLPDC